MGPSKKSRIVKKRLFKVNEKLQDKEETKASKSKVKKRKLSDMLGSQWSKEELECFYEAYLKYGKDWKKVASVFQNRSADMVEALYNMNRAYLSLPAGMVTVAGLIAMMTDHYNILDESESDRERNPVPRMPYKPHRRDHEKLQVDMSSKLVGAVPDHLQNQSGPSNSGCLSFLRRNSGDLLADNRPRAVGKRTPRIPIASLQETSGWISIISHDKQTSKSMVDAAANEHAHLAALALAEASQRGGSPQISCTPAKKTNHTRPSPVNTGQEKDAESEASRMDYIGGGTDLESLRSTQGKSRLSAANTRVLDTEAARDMEARQKVKKLKVERPENLGIESLLSDEVREACNATDRGYYIRTFKDETETVATDEKTRHASQRPRKKSRQLSRDESCALDALHTLADASLNTLLPSSAAKSEADVHKQEREGDAAHESIVPGGLSKNHESSKKYRASLEGKKGDGVDLVTRGCANHDMPVRKRKSLAEETSVEDTNRNVRQFGSLPKQGKSIQKAEFPVLSEDPRKTVTNMPESTSQNSILDRVTVLAKGRNRRKMGLQKSFVHMDSSDRGGNKCPNKCSLFVNDEVADRKEKLSHCLSSKMLRRWCAYEWFYSAIDYPWFARREFVEYLDHVQLGHVPRLTRVEWSVIRSSLGKPRRLSKRFLLEERKRLELYRESVRAHYAELHAGVREGLPTDLARPLSVGQHVSARHPKTREIHNGKVLIVDYNRFRVQFDRSDLGVELVPDIDCMPLNPWKNMPEDLRMQNVSVDKLCHAFANVKPHGQFMEWEVGQSQIASYESLETADGASLIASSKYSWGMPMKQEKGDTFDSTMKAKDVANKAAAQQPMSCQPCTLAQIQEREADVKALADLTRALDKKEALLTELRQMNEEACGKQKGRDLISDCESRKQYAMILLQLQDANDHVASALLCLRQRNTYQGNLWSGPSVGPPGCFSISDLNQDSGSHLIEIVESSRQKARTMVDAAVQQLVDVQEVNSLKEREDPLLRTSGPLTFVENRHSGADSSLSRIRCFPPNPSSSSLEYQDQVALCAFEPTKKVSGSSPMVQISLKVSPNANEAQFPFPSELISACATTLLMIQNCTERQYPPGEVARIMESAVTSLQPCCSQNLPIYREIEACMGIIKNQMLALVPTPSSAFRPEVSV